jgi:hypothetical protein
MSNASAHWHVDPRAASLARALVFVAFWRVIVWLMDRGRIYLKL